MSSNSSARSRLHLGADTEGPRGQAQREQRAKLEDPAVDHAELGAERVQVLGGEVRGLLRLRDQQCGGEDQVQVRQVDLDDLAADLAAQRLERGLARLADAGRRVASSTGRGPRRSAGLGLAPPGVPLRYRAEASSRQSAASRQRGPETMVSVLAMWWPSIAERPKVGFSPVRPQ